MSPTTSGLASLRGLVLATFTLLSLLHAILSAEAVRDRRSPSLHLARDGLLHSGRMDKLPVNDGLRPRNTRMRRNTADSVVLTNTHPEVLKEEMEEVQDGSYPVEDKDVKRRWTSGRNMAVWGKRDVHDDVINDEEKRKWTGDRKMAVWGKRDDGDIDEIKRKWTSDRKMAVWGKRSDQDNDVNAEKRKWRSGNKMELWGKRKWSSRNMAVWGKRGWEDPQLEDELEAKRAWRGRDMAVWG